MVGKELCALSCRGTQEDVRRQVTPSIEDAQKGAVAGAADSTSTTLVLVIPPMVLILALIIQFQSTPEPHLVLRDTCALT